MRSDKPMEWDAKDRCSRRRGWWPAAVAAVAVAVATLSVSAGQSLPRFPPPLIEGHAVGLAAHSHVIPDRNVLLVPNVGLVIGRRAALIVDTGMGPRNGRTVLDEVIRLAPGRRLFVVATHVHAEHVSGLSAFPANTTFIASRAMQQDLDALGDQGMAGMSRLTPFIGELLKDVHVRRADIVFERQRRLDLGGVHVRLLALGPTHTNGDTMAWVEEDRVLYAGDVVLKDRFLSFGADSSRRRWLDVLAEVKALRPRIIVPSHGESGDASMVDDQVRVLAELHARVADLKREGRTLDETSQSVVAEFKAKYPAWQATIPNEIGPIVRALYAE
jgi:glyoxylase-like metal-dependent hydrolase (beta-lactamase superfamily II)